MDAQQIQTLRAMLSAQNAAEQTRPPSLGLTVSRLLAPRARRPSVSPPSPSAPPPTPGTPSERPLLHGGAETISPSDDPLDLAIPPIWGRASPAEPARAPLPPEILLGEFSPRRHEFGQRAEPVLTLQSPAPPPQRLMLIAMGGEAVGEIILHQDAPASKRRQPSLNPLESETPFFPEDLADDRPARHHGLHRLPPPAPPAPQPPPPADLAAAFLLATLAARLASEEARLTQRLGTAPRGAPDA